MILKLTEQLSVLVLHGASAYQNNAAKIQKMQYKL